MHIHQIRGRLANGYVIEDVGGLLVVDVAWRAEKYVLGYLREVLGRPFTDVALVTCTHGDPDHCGGVENLARICGAAWALPYATRKPWRQFANDPTGPLVRAATTLAEGLRPRAWAMYGSRTRTAAARRLPSYRPAPSNASAPSPPAAARLQDRRRLPGFADWEVVHTPGHSWDSCCFFHAPSGSLLSGDTLLGSRTQGRPVAPSVYANPWQLARTYRRLQALDARAVYPGHGDVFTGAGLLAHL